MLTLDERLALCASFVRDNAALADIGTDHAYLPVWLVLNGRIRSAVAADVREGPLRNAASAVEMMGVGDRVSTVLSDGLDNIAPEQAEDIVMAGMGGELIIKLIDRTDWLRDSSHRLILQPMTRAEVLRRYLCENGFEITEEKACISSSKVYSVMCCQYDGKHRECSDEFAWAGKLAGDRSEASERYIGVICEKLRKHLRGLKEGSAEYIRMQSLIDTLNRTDGGDKDGNCV